MTLERKLTLFIFLISSFLCLYFLTELSVNYTHSNNFYDLITIDVIVTIPFIYFLLIRKTNAPKVSVIPVLLLGTIIASYIIPEDQQLNLQRIKTWVIPVLEVFVLCFITYKLSRAIKRFKSKKNSNSDFYSILKKTCEENLPKSIVAPVVTEISVFYYGFIYWKKRKLKTNEFTYHKESGSLTLLITILFLIVVETFVFHLLIARWNTTVAWILTGLSIYTGVQIFGFLKSILKRPIVINNGKLLLRYGFMKETIIDINDISSIIKSSIDIDEDKSIQKLSLLSGLESHNTIIYLNNENTIVSLYGIKKKYTAIALSIDNYENFKKQISSSMSNFTNP